VPRAVVSRCSKLLAQIRFDLPREPLHFGKIGAQDLDADRHADAGREHVDAGLDRHGPGIGNARRCPSRRSNCRRLSQGAIRSAAFRLITVSNISVGTESVGVDAHPALPQTEASSGNDLRIPVRCGFIS